MAADRTSHKLDAQELAAIECPLQLGQRPANQPMADCYGRLMDRLGGQRRLSSLLQAKNPNRPVELKLVQSDANPFVRPIAGEFVNTSNILIRIIKRTRKPKHTISATPSKDNQNSTSQANPLSTTRLYKLESVGVITLTVRFRALADYHYTPDLKHPINILANDIRSLNAEGVLNFRFENETEDYSSSSKIALFPPPLFSRYLIPQLYNYRQNGSSVIAGTSEGGQRLVNRSRYVPRAPQTITFDQPQVPQGPLESDVMKKKISDESIYQQVEALFDARPMWIRLAFQNQFPLRQVRLLRQNREILVLSCYTFVDGPFKDLLIKFKYDPRLDPQARFYQKISLRNVDKRDPSDNFVFKLMKRNVPKGSSSAGFNATAMNQSRDHIFDGLELHQSVGTYQLCDITDPLLKSLINSTKGVLPKCHVRTGWYTSNAIEQIRCILRKKFHALLEEQRVLKDIECVDLLDIDVSLDAADLVKKYSVTEKRFQVSQKFNIREGTDLELELDRELSYPEELNQTLTDNTNRKTTPTKIHPNPLRQGRREKKRIKAKPKDKSVTFFDPKDLEEDGQMTEKYSDITTTAKEKTGDDGSEITSTITDGAGKTSTNTTSQVETGGALEEEEEEEEEDEDGDDDENSSDDEDDEDEEEEEEDDDDDEEFTEEDENEEDVMGNDDDDDEQHQPTNVS